MGGARRFGIFLTGLALIVVAADVVRGAVTLKAYYEMGEDGDVPATSLIASIGTNAARDFALNNSLLSIITGTTGAQGSTKYLSTQAAGWSPGTTGGATLAEYGSTNWGMSVWLKMPTLAAANAKGSGTNYIMSSGSQTANLLSMNRAAADTYWWSLGATNAQTVRVDNGLFDTWVHAAFVYNGTGTNNMQLYVNGVLTGSKTQSASYTTGRGQQLWIGTASNNTTSNGGNQWVGGMDELKVFTFAAGEFAISDVYNPVPEPGVMVAFAGLVGLVPLLRPRHGR